MWEQYKKTFGATQVVIGMVTFGVLLWSRVWSVAGLFFVTMQIAAVIGAMWGHRLKGKAARTMHAR